MVDSRYDKPRVFMSAWGPQGVDEIGPSEFDTDTEVEITQWVSSVQWLKSVQSPWETIQLVVRMAREDWSTFFPGTRNDDPKKGRNTSRQPGIGWWVTIKLPEPEASIATTEEIPVTIAWGRVENIQFTLRPGQVGRIETDRVNITCGSWINLVANTRAILAAGDVDGETGFIYGMRAWSKRMKTFMRSLKEERPGILFDKIWRAMVKVRIPPALSGGKTDAFIGEQIPVIWNKELCEEFIPTRTHQQLDLHGYAINAFGASRGPNGSLLQLFRGAFGADQNLTEFFPTIDYPWRRGEATQATFQTAVGKALGAQPVLMYRMRPWLLNPITREIRTGLLAEFKESGMHDAEFHQTMSLPTASEKVGLFQTATPFTAAGVGTTAEPLKVEFTLTSETDPSAPVMGTNADPKAVPETIAMTHTPDDIYSFTYAHKDSDRINGVYVQTPMQPNTTMQMHGAFGKPIINIHDARKNGLRMYDIDWPMFPATASGSSSLLKNKLNAIVEVGAEFFAHGEAFASGSAELRYKPELTPGTWQSFTPAYSEGDRGGLRIVGYVETVSTIFETTDAGKIRARTTVQFIKGIVEMDAEHTSPERPFDVRTPFMWKTGKNKSREKAMKIMLETGLALTDMSRKMRANMVTLSKRKKIIIRNKSENAELEDRKPDVTNQEGFLHEPTSGDPDNEEEGE